jgi:hypothetical protein
VTRLPGVEKSLPGPFLKRTGPLQDASGSYLFLRVSGFRFRAGFKFRFSGLKISGFRLRGSGAHPPYCEKHAARISAPCPRSSIAGVSQDFTSQTCTPNRAASDRADANTHRFRYSTRQHAPLEVIRAATYTGSDISPASMHRLRSYARQHAPPRSGKLSVAKIITRVEAHDPS